MSNKITISSLVAMVIMAPVSSLADPVIAGLILPPASFTHVEDTDTLIKLGLDGVSGGAWCYDNDANAILITAASRARAQCELSLQYELEKQKVKNQFAIDKLNIRIEALTEQHREINLIKDKEIDKLTEAALKRPNDYSVWWATGGLVVGVLSSALLYSMVK